MRTRMCPATLAVLGCLCVVLGANPAKAAAPAVSAGSDHSVALKPDGTLSSWGNDSAGQLGLNRTISSDTPRTVPGLPRIVAIAAGAHHSVALAADGSVWSWGSNASGQLGDGSQTDRVTPVRAVGLSGVVAIAAGSRHTLALKSDGSVWSWGDDDFGQLGRDGSGGIKASPGPVQGLSAITAIAAGAVHSVALGGDGQVWTWGSNYYGELGDGTTEDRRAPISVLFSATSITAGCSYTLAARRDGFVYVWGLNNYGQLGDGTTQDRHTPTQISLSGVRTISASCDQPLTFSQVGGDHTLALKPDGSVWGWGSNQAGEVDGGDANGRISYLWYDEPVQVAGITGATDVRAGGRHSLALLSSGTVRAWGDDEYGQAGASFSSVDFAVHDVPNIKDATAIAAGAWHSMALRRDGTVVVWGFNGFGNLADATPLRRSVPTQIPNVSNVVGVSAGAQHTVVVTGDGARSEEHRVGKECRSRWSPYH